MPHLSTSRSRHLDRLLAALRTPATRGTILFSLLWTALTALYLWPLIGNHYVPAQDMGDHLAMVNIWRSLSSSPVMQAYYVARPGFQPYMLHYGLLRGLATFVSLETANKLVLITYAASFPLSLLYLFTRFGKDRRYALLTFPFIYNAYFVYGFLANLLALPILFVVLGLLKSYLDQPKIWRELLLAFMLLVLSSTHLLVLASFAVAAPVIFFAHVHHPLRALRRSLFVWPTALISAAWTLHQSGHGKLQGHWIGLDKNMRLFLTWLNDIFRDNDDEIVLLAVVLSVGLLLLLPVRSKNAPTSKSWSLPAAGLALLLAYFLAPAHMTHPRHWATGARLALPAFVLLLAIPQTRVDRWRQLVLVPGLAVIIWGGYQTWSHFHRFDRMAQDIDHVLAFIPPHQRVLPLVYDENDGIHQAHALRSMLLLYQARKGGYMPEGFTQANQTHMPIRARYPKIAPFWKNPRGFNYRAHGRHYDYFLAVLPRRDHLRQWKTFPGAGKHVRLLAQRGRFAAYNNLDR